MTDTIYNIVDESVDRKIVETQMMIEAVRSAILKLNDERDIIERLCISMMKQTLQKQ